MSMTTCKSDLIVYLLTSMISPAWFATLLVILLPSHISLYFNLSSWKPSTAIQEFVTTIDKAMTVFKEHKHVLRGTEFKRKLLLFRLELRTLSQQLRVAGHAFSWWNCRSWPKHISMMKKIFEEAQNGQREVKALKGEVEDIIFSDERETLCLEVEIMRDPVGTSTEAPEVLRSSSLSYQVSLA
ncbi:uncharacterized protein EV420DRAFT_1649514 [Desarmillaria tabescens]|uniref:Uncharacterized protein n=1 Tax=Armillaria tabescens TaxID=1929756 RepID=A0AA39JLS6_ARMTA|nr:uncharacterized protein EV420DRAFT_1649514 [Desarmillaria tabescens]KAK0442768.1 hypothetical protein EV420DRAFT_1649514 [Desarmillaria tabescens]